MIIHNSTHCYNIRIMPAESCHELSTMSRTSWYSYLAVLLSTDHVMAAGVWDRATYRELCATADFADTVTQREIAAIVQGCLIPDSVYKKTLSLAGQLSTVYIADGRAVYAKTVEVPAGARGFTACLSGRTVVVAAHTAGMDPTVCNELVIRLAETLRANHL